MKRVARSLGLIPAAVAGALLAGAGCGKLIKGGPIGLGVGGSSGGAPGGGAGLALSGRGDAARAAELYKKFTYRDVTASDATTLFSSAGIAGNYNPKKDLKNPDPTWIPGWDALELTDEAQTALLQAAINRTWTAQAHDDYRRHRAAWKAIDGALRPKLDQALAEGGYYERATALAALYGEVRARAEADRVYYPASTPLGAVGLENDVVRAMVQIHRDAHLEFLVDEYLAKAGVDLRKFLGAGRPFAADDVERDLFTAYAQQRGTPFDTPALPALRDYGRGFAAVAWPTSDERDRAIAQARTKLVTDNAAALAVIDARAPNLFTGGTGDAAEPVLRLIDGKTSTAVGSYTPVVVDKVTRKDGGTVIELESKYEQSFPYDCKTTDQWDAHGERVKQCKYKHVATRQQLTVTFGALPAGVELQRGDVVTLYADLVAKKESKGTVTYQLTGRALASVVRDGEPIATYW